MSSLIKEARFLEYINSTHQVVIRWRHNSFFTVLLFQGLANVFTVVHDSTCYQTYKQGYHEDTLVYQNWIILRENC